MRISDWSSDVCSSDLLSVTSAIVQTSGLMTEGEAETFTDDLPQLSTTPFGKSAMMKGGQTIQAWLSDNDDTAPAKLAQYVEEWSDRSEEHTSELQSLMRISYAVFCLKKKNKHKRA